MNNKYQPKYTLYRDIPKGVLFRVIEPEQICSRLVRADGVLVKIANSQAVRLDDHKTFVVGLKAKCRTLPAKIDTRDIHDWNVVNVGNPENKK